MSPLTGEFEVIRLYKDTPGLRLGIVHMPVTRAAFSANIDGVRHVIRYASSVGVKTLILPPHMPYGMPPETLNDKLTVNAISVDKRNPYIRILKRLSRLHALSIISPHVLERSRKAIYVSNIFIDGEAGTCRFFSRKLLLSQKERMLGMKPGNKLDSTCDYYLRYVALLDEDLLMPELARLLTLIGGADLVVTCTRSELVEDLKPAELLKALQVFIATPIIHVGSVIFDASGGDVHDLPTLITIPGNEVFEYNEIKRGALITAPIKVFKGAKKSDSVDQFKPVLKILARYLRNVTVTS